MFQTATIWNICQGSHRRYRFTGEAERFVCWLREGAAEKLRGSNATCHLYKHLKFFQPFLTSSCIAPQQYANSNNSQFCHCSFFYSVTCQLHAPSTVLKGFCSVLGLFRVAQLHASYMSYAQVTTSNSRE